jgi:hypothetical protein
MLLAVPFSAFAVDPVISPNPSVAVFVTGAYITWETDIASTSRVDYGTTTAYGSNVTDGSSVTYHSLTVTGLTANTTYHYKVTSGATVSADFTFTTYANPTGTVRTVGSGKTHTTIQACVNAMNAGDTCLVYSGTYNETVTVGSGSAGNYKTILAQEAATVTTFNVGSRNYAAVKGFQITGGGIAGGGNSTYVLIENNYINSPSGACINPRDTYTSNWWIVRKNIMYKCGYVGIFITGSNTLIEDNDISHQVNDCFYGGLTNSVIRNNVCHDYNPQGSGQHLDFVQWDGSSAVAFSQSLIEGNTAQRCVDSTHNCHVVILRNPGGSPASQNTIVRYNYAQSIDGGGIMMGGGSTDSVPYSRIYNNTLALEYKPAENASFVTYYISNYSKAFNNISYNTGSSRYSPFDSSTGSVGNYNIAYDSAYPSASWASPYTTEATFNTLKNQNPTFTNYPYSAAISSSSPAKDAGGALTTVSSGCGTSTLVLADARWFQPGWAGTNADWLAIGTVTNAYQISSITYSTNTVVFTGAVSCTNGNSIWLYKKSDGAQVLYGTAPDIGAYEYGTSSHPSPPKGLKLISP